MEEMTGALVEKSDIAPVSLIFAWNFRLFTVIGAVDADGSSNVLELAAVELTIPSRLRKIG